MDMRDSSRLGQGQEKACQAGEIPDFIITSAGSVVFHQR